MGWLSQHELAQLAHYKALYERHGAGRTNLAYGYVRKAG
jgi:hypothetical protein